MKSTSNIREHMEVVGSCGGRVGKVDRVEGLSIKLTKDSPNADGEHRYIPLAWVESVDTSVHLRNCARTCKNTGKHILSRKANIRRKSDQEILSLDQNVGRVIPGPRRFK